MGRNAKFECRDADDGRGGERGGCARDMHVHVPKPTEQKRMESNATSENTE